MSMERIGRNPSGDASNVAVSNCQFPLRILVFKESVGAIIGRGGSMIRNITRETKARVDVNRKEYNSSDKAVTIYGTPESQSEACQRILSVMIEEASVSNNRQDIALKILAHDDLVGRLIGKDGQTIKKIMKDSNTKINVSSISQLSGENVDRVITIQGTVQGMMMAETLISERLRKSYFDDLRVSPTSNVLNQRQVRAMHSLLSGNGRCDFLSENQNRGQLSLSQWPPSLNLLPAAFAEQWMRSCDSMGDFHNCEKEDTVQLVVPSKAVGGIIGRKGNFIKNIKLLSGAQIKILTAQGPVQSERELKGSRGDSSDDCKLKDERVRKIEITGNFEQQWRAQTLVYEKMKADNVFLPENRFTVELIVKNNIVGKLIGKGGTNIKELMARTGSKIVIENDPESRPSPNTNAIPDVASCSESMAGVTEVSVQSPLTAKRVKITGSFSAVQLAQRQILALVNQSSNPLVSKRKHFFLPPEQRKAFKL